MVFSLAGNKKKKHRKIKTCMSLSMRVPEWREHGFLTHTFATKFRLGRTLVSLSYENRHVPNEVCISTKEQNRNSSVVLNLFHTESGGARGSETRDHSCASNSKASFQPSRSEDRKSAMAFRLRTKP